MKSSRLLKIALWALAFLVFYSVLGFVAVPAIVKKVIVTQVETQLHREASVQSVFFNPFTLQARVRGLQIEDRIAPKPMLTFDELYIKVSPSSLYRRAPVLSTIRLLKPYVSV